MKLLVDTVHKLTHY